jgi:putative ABC transport system substrate-binding protein
MPLSAWRQHEPARVYHSFRQRPFTVRAQQTNRVPWIGVMIAAAESAPVTKTRVTAFRQGLDALGWTDGQNIRIGYRWDIGGPEQAGAVARELVVLTPDVILPSTTAMVAAVRQENQSLPIVFSKARKSVTCRSSNRPNLNSSSTSRLPKHSV